MLRSKWMQLAAGVLVVIAVVYNVSVWRGRSRSGAAAAERPGVSAAGAATDTAAGRYDHLLVALSEGRPEAAAPERIQALLARPVAWATNPFAFREPQRDVAEEGNAPQVVQSEIPQPPAWRLTAVLAGEGRKVAVINGRSYGEGDRIDGGVVEQIESRTVRIRWQGQTVRLELRPHSFRIP